MRTTFRAVALVMSLIFGSAAHAATVKTIEGNVLINRGNGYERVSGTSQAKVGDSVMVSPNGVAQIIYADGCAVTVRPGSVRVVETRSSCKTAAAFAGTRMGAGLGDGDWSTQVQPAHQGLHDWAIFTLPVAIAIGGLVFLFDDDDKPVSP